MKHRLLPLLWKEIQGFAVERWADGKGRRYNEGALKPSSQGLEKQ